jgi:hypothetical protein
METKGYTEHELDGVLAQLVLVAQEARAARVLLDFIIDLQAEIIHLKNTPKDENINYGFDPSVWGFIRELDMSEWGIESGEDDDE